MISTCIATQITMYLYISVNTTHMILSEDPKGYVISRATHNDNDFGIVLREKKYYYHLSDVY
jgi:hypothetical protein